jgi:hypothetical protein
LLTLFIQPFIRDNTIDTLVAVSWGGGEYGRFGKAFYGVEVFLVEGNDDYAVKARFHIGRGNGYYHICELGLVSSPSEAVDKFGVVNWTKQGVTIGKGDTSFFMSRKELENHR